MIPVINLTGENAKPGTSSWVSAREKVKAAMEEHGYFLAIHDQFSSEASAAVTEALKEVFDLPLEVKKRNVSDNPFYGYRGQKPSMPLYESLGVFDASLARDIEPIRSFTNLMWPSGNQSFCEIMNYFVKKLSDVDRMVSRMIYESYGLEKYYDRDWNVESVAYLFRMMIYRVPGSGDDQYSNVGCLPHSDKTLLTVIHQNEVNGYQVKTKAGEWITVDFPPSSLLITAGDSLSGWSNGRIYAPVHQVIMREKEARYTLGTFSFHKGTIQIPKELVDDEHPLLYKPFNVEGLLEYYGTEEGQQAPDLLKAYCGV
ncbi:OLC1v1024645C1 [Oldenlandia corymbosa var. corymbosa]|uniref:OLC1v1024645C1 n=1 Tax=Oldenlandia corymbosa var. corymbosa TaxID=529605 RepID=A0AAV1C542_OLDCO|nr:OLC1v1024645C1 [Oldenlandia corymbosa var. corymbosa]